MTELLKHLNQEKLIDQITKESPTEEIRRQLIRITVAELMAAHKK